MIMPNQITNHEFTYSKGMYKAAEVDAFLKEIEESYDKTFRENGELVKKLGILADKVEEYRAEEDNIRVALLAAQKAANQLTTNAQQEAEKTMEEATINSQAILATAKEEAQLATDDADAYVAKVTAEADQKANETISRAQSSANALLADAQFKAEALVAEANEEAAKAKADYQRNKKIEEVALEAIKRETAKFKSELLEIYRAHISLINEIPALIEVDESDFEEDEETEAPVVPVPAEAAPEMTDEAEQEAESETTEEAEEPAAQEAEQEELEAAEEPAAEEAEEIAEPETEETPAEEVAVKRRRQR